ncbi:MAG TPA: amidase [Burkholderiales bacterium]|nr:amidase [Burkholderiales bacterium]
MKVIDKVDAALDDIVKRDGQLGAWQAVDPEFARRQARALDSGAARGLLHGMTLGVKDIFDTADLPTEHGSRIYAGHRPAWDAACVALARAAGAIVLGKTVTTEFATMVPARTVHPLDSRRTPGGSSSGSAAAVAAGMARFAFGSQTVGSTIRPAAYCGVVGYKPTFGTLSRSGMKMGAESLDTVGVIARTVDDAALLTAGSGMRNDLAGGEILEKPRLAICRSPNWHQMSREGAEAFLASVDRLGGQGARILEREVPFEALDKATIAILFYEMARGLAYEMTHHRARISPALVQRVEEGAAIPYAEYTKALAYAADCRKRLADLIGDVDAILTPSTTGEAPLGLQSTGNTAMNRLWTLLYGPCVTVPSGVGPSGMPLGIQLVGLPGSDARTLAAARWVENAIRGQGANSVSESRP